MIQKKIDNAKILLEALPYIKKFHHKTIVIKYGGSIMVREDLKRLFATDIVLLKYVGINPIIVHGGGKEITKWMQKVGKESVFVDGLRVTDSETMEITEMVLSGKINNEILSLINLSGGKAVGLSGKDANLFSAKRIRSKDDKDIGMVGGIDQTNVALLHTLCEKGYIPIIASVANDEHAQSLNINADHAASAIAGAMNAEKLVYLTDVEGLLIDGQLQNQLTLENAKSLRSHSDVSGGMLPKLNCAIEALEHSVKQVHIINGTIEHAILLELFTDQGIGTMIGQK